MKHRLAQLAPWAPAAAVVAAIIALALAAPADPAARHRTESRGPAVMRIGFLPNITHAQALVAQATGEFESHLGGPVEWIPFSAGPLAIEAMFSGELDAAYVGPNPAINGYLRSKGESFVVVAGAASGGAALVLAPGFARRHPDGADVNAFHTAIVATPQLGNTQDVAARNWFADHGLETIERGGTLTIMPLSPADQLLLFQRGQLDAAWTVEPWVSRLEQEAGGRVLLEEGDLWPRGRYCTTTLIVSRRFLREQAGLARKLVEAHAAMTDQINADRPAAARMIDGELRRLTGKSLPPGVAESALRRIDPTVDPMETSLRKNAQDAFRIGFLRREPNLQGIVDATLLNAVLQARQAGGEKP